MRKEHFKPKVLITMGDPAGIGPEICACCMADREINRHTRPVLIGDEAALRRAMAIRNINGIRVNRIESPEEAVFEEMVSEEAVSEEATVNLIQPHEDYAVEIPFGEMSVQGADMAYSYIVRAIEAARLWEADLVVTAPINKESFHQAGVPQKDHTSIFKSYYKEARTVSMFHCRELCVFHYTRHMSLKDAIAALDVQRLAQTIAEIHAVLKSFGVEKPRIAVAALNPHASDNGLFGEEEAQVLEPAIERCLEQGITVYGPVPADAVFYLQKQGKYDGILSLFHDQGHIACKAYDFERSVSLTFGLPFMRSTVDHGTAYDLAGKGTASYENLREAILVGADYCCRYQAHAMK